MSGSGKRGRFTLPPDSAERPQWRDYLPLLDGLTATGFPSLPDLERIKPPGIRNHLGRPIRFVDSDRLTDGENYELRIYRTGRVSTRPDNWHDLFNALVWMRLPRLKAAMNLLHFREIQRRGIETRGPVRDALTHFDECGMIVVSSSDRLLDALRGHDWASLFVANRQAWNRRIIPVVCGHALLEKFLAPYRAITANALLLKTTEAALRVPWPRLLERLDETLAARLAAGSCLHSPRDLAPLPVMGIPGWHDGQDGVFYGDTSVFRPRSASVSARVLHLGD